MQQTEKESWEEDEFEEFIESEFPNYTEVKK